MYIKLLKGSVSLIFLFIILILFYLQILRGDYYYERGLKNCIRILPEKGKRGDILDRKKVSLAKDKISFDVYISPIVR